mmetsp:Transcript_20915/g.31110  ORF Transcript_20915/g.31110 Transcript_20915/m.31110 type:complete len:88 (+) Transcript_20915:106-369(+)
MDGVNRTKNKDQPRQYPVIPSRMYIRLAQSNMLCLLREEADVMYRVIKQSAGEDKKLAQKDAVILAKMCRNGPSSMPWFLPNVFIPS